MSSVDQRVVNLKFDNADFERRIQSTLNALAQLGKGLKLEGATKGLTNVQAAGKNLQLDHISSGVDKIASRFSAMNVIAIAALAAITAKAVQAGTQLVKSLTIGPIADGFSDYNEKLTSVQTIMNATGASLQKVSTYFSELDTYSDKTIYNLRDMTGAFAKFTNAGVKMEVSVPAIKGIANMVALAGQSADAAAIAMYNLSQSIAGGFLTTTDYRSLNLANVATKEWKNQMIAGAVAAGKLKKGAGDTYAVVGSGSTKAYTSASLFNEALSEGWASTDVLLKVLGDYGDETTAIGKKALAAAQDVKSLPMMMETLKATAGTGWTDTFEILLGTVPEATALFTGLTNTIGGFLNAMTDARNSVLKDWKALGGRTAAIDAIKNAFNALVSVVKPIKDAFREIFPATTGKDLYKITTAIRDFTKGLGLGSATANNLKRTFAGVFAIFGIGWEIIKQVAKTLFGLFGAIDGGGSSFLEITAKIGDFLVKLHQAIKTGDGLGKVFAGIGKVLAIPIKLLSMFAGYIAKAFGGLGDIDTSGLDRVQERLAPLGALGKVLASIWSNMIGILKNVWKVFEPLTEKISEGFQKMIEGISGSMTGANFSGILDLINTGLLAGLVLIIRNFLKKGLGDLSGGLVGVVKGTFGQLTATLGAMQAQLKANALLKIAAAIAILTISMVALSLIDSDKLGKALTAMAAMFASLIASMALLTKITSTAGFIKMPLLTASLILLAIAIDLLTIAVTRLSKLDWNELAKGLLGTGVLIGALVLASKGLAGGSAGLMRSSAAFILLAIAINILVSAVEDLADLSWEEMAKGIGGVAVLLTALALFTKFADTNKGGISSGAGLLLLAVGIKILASALIDIASLSWEELAKGLVGMALGLTLMAAALILIPPTSLLSAAAILVVAASLGMIADALEQMGGMSWGEIGRGLTLLAGALTLIALALTLIPPTSLLSAAAVFVVAASLEMLADALGIMGGMSWEEIAKGLVTLAGSLGIIAVGLALMQGALAGAAALLVVSASLRILAPVLEMFSEMSWEEIAKGLTMLAGVFVVVGLAGALLTPVIPTLIGLGIAITLLGVGMLLAGAGLVLFSIGLTTLAVAGAAGAGAIIGIVKSLLGLIPMVMEQIALGIIAFAKVIAVAGPTMTRAIVTVMESLNSAILRMTPKIVSTLAFLMLFMLRKMVSYVPQMTDAGLKIIIGFLRGIAANMGRVVTTATDVIVAFINGVARNQPRIVDAGFKLIIAFINGLASAIRANSAAMGEAGANLASAIVEGMIRGLGAGLSRITSKARDLASSALSAAKSALGIGSPSKAFRKIGMFSAIGMANGLKAYAGQVADSAEGVGKGAISALSKSISGLSDVYTGDLDITPTITPVLDLSDVKKNAGQLGTLLSIKPIAVDTSYFKAKDASIGYENNKNVDSTETPVVASTTSLVFNQNNNSPKALSPADIYRQTRNQLSVAKGALSA